jgi:S-adenosylmethionine decarboxylase
MTHNYTAGLHLLLTLLCPDKSKLNQYANWLAFIEGLLINHDLEKVGETFFQFDTGGFTAAICLKESHICIHTWPEFGLLTLDVYVCNYQQNNTEKVKQIANQNILYFNAFVEQKHEVYR